MNLSFRNYWTLLAVYIRPQKLRFSVMATLLLVSICLQVINPQIMRRFIDAALAQAPLNQLVMAGVVFLVIALVQQALSVCVTYLGESVAWTAANNLRGDLAAHCLKLDMGFHNDHTPGELIERIDGDVTEMATFFSQFVVILVGNLLLLVGILVALFLEDWRLGLGFSAYAFISLLILSRVRNLAVVDQKNLRQAEADMYGFIEEQLSGTEDIRSSGAVDYSLRVLFQRQAGILKHDRLANFKNWKIGLVMGSLLTIGSLLAVSSGYLLYTAGLVTVGTVYLLIHYIAMLETPLWALTHQVQSFQTIGACVERLTELKSMQNVVPEGEGKEMPSGALGLLFEDVSFAYLTSEPVLQNLSFSLKAGSVLGLLGRTGSGKTTLARLVFRLYDPTSGSIHLDGAGLTQPRLEALRRRVAMVTQDVQIFRASVRDNLTFFDKEITDTQIYTAIDALELREWFGQLPKGLDTELDTGAHSLSAGEAQLLAFTRVLLQDPGLVILDEASSRLDPVTEVRIERAIDRLLRDRTAIIIAHRLGTVARADDILILESGQALEFGPRRELAHDPSSQLYHLLQTGMEEVLV